MTDEQKLIRIQRILQQTRVIFISDSAERLADARLYLARWRSGEVSRERLGEQIYGLAHAVKGVALTIGLEDVHQQAETIAATIIQYRDGWTEDTFSLLLESFDELAGSLDKLAEEQARKPGTP